MRLLGLIAIGFIIGILTVYTPKDIYWSMRLAKDKYDLDHRVYYCCRDDDRAWMISVNKKIENCRNQLVSRDDGNTWEKLK